MAKRPFEVFEADVELSNFEDTGESSNNIVIVPTVVVSPAPPAKKIKVGASAAPFQQLLLPGKKNPKLNDIPVPSPTLPTEKSQVTTTVKDPKCSDNKIGIKTEDLTKKPTEKTVSTTFLENAKAVLKQKSVTEEKMCASEVKGENDQSKVSPNKSCASNYLKSIRQTYKKPIKINLSLLKNKPTSVKEVLEKNEANNDAKKADEKDVLNNRKVIIDKSQTPNQIHTEKIPLNTNPQYLPYTHYNMPGPPPVGQFIIPNTDRTLSNMDHFRNGTVPLPPPLHLHHEYYYCCNPNNNMPPALQTPGVNYAPHLHHNISYGPYEAHFYHNNFMLDRTLHENYRMNAQPYHPPNFTDRIPSDRSYLEKIDKFLAKVSQDAPYDRYDKDRSPLRRRFSVESSTSGREIYHDYHRSHIEYESNPHDRDEIKTRRYEFIEKSSISKEKRNIHKFGSIDHKTPEQFKGVINTKSRNLERRNSVEDFTQYRKKLRVGSKTFIEKTRNQNNYEINENNNYETDHKTKSHKTEENEKNIKEKNKFQEGIRRQILPAYEIIKEEDYYKINIHNDICDNKVEMDGKRQSRRSNSSDKNNASHNPQKSVEKAHNDAAKSKEEKLRLQASKSLGNNFNKSPRKCKESKTNVENYNEDLRIYLKSKRVGVSRRSEEHEYNKSNSEMQENFKRRASKRKASEFTEGDDIKFCNKSPRENKKQQTLSIYRRDTASLSPRRHDDKAHIKSTAKKSRLASPVYSEDEGKYRYNRIRELRESMNTRQNNGTVHKSFRKSEENDHNGSSKKHESERPSEELNHSKYDKNVEMCKNLIKVDRKKPCLSDGEADEARHSSRTPERTEHNTSYRRKDKRERSSSKEKSKKSLKDIIAQKIKMYTEELKKLNRSELYRNSDENKPEKTRNETPSTLKHLKDSDYTKRLHTSLRRAITFKDDSELLKTDENFDLRTKLSRPNLNQCTNIFPADNSKIFETVREGHENLVVTVANDEVSKSEEAAPDPEYTSRISKNKKVKKIQLVFDVLYEESDSSETEEKSADKGTKKSSLNPEDLSFLDDLNIDEIVSSLKSNQKEFNVTKKKTGNSNNTEEYVISDDDSDASTVHLEDMMEKMDDDEQPDVTITEFEEKDDKNLLGDLVIEIPFAEQRFIENMGLKGTKTMGNEIGHNVELISSDRIKQEIDDEKNCTLQNKCPNKSENDLQTATSIQDDEKELFKRLFTPMVEIKEEPIEILSDDEASTNNNPDISKFIANKLDTTPNTAECIDSKISADQNATKETDNSLSENDLQTATSIQDDEKELFKRLFTPMVEIKEEPIEILSDEEASTNNNPDISKFIVNKPDTTPNTAECIDSKISADQNATKETDNSLSPAIKIITQPVNIDDVAPPNETTYPKDCGLTNNINTKTSEPMETEHNTGVITDGTPIIGLSKENCVNNTANVKAVIKKEPEEIQQNADISMDDTRNKISATETTNAANIYTTPEDNAHTHEIKTKKDGEDDSISRLKSPEEKSLTQNDEIKNKSILHENITTNNNVEKYKSHNNFLHAAPDMGKSNAITDIVKLTKEHNIENNETINAKQQTDNIRQLSPCQKENKEKAALKWSDDNAVNVKTLMKQLESIFEETDVKTAKTKDDTVDLTGSGTHTKELKNTEVTTTENTGAVINVNLKLASNLEKPLHEDKEVENEETTMQKELHNVSISEKEPRVSEKIKETPHAEKPHENYPSNSKTNHNDSQSNSSVHKELPDDSVSENEPGVSEKIKDTPNAEEPHEYYTSNSKTNHNDSQSNVSVSENKLKVSDKIKETPNAKKPHENYPSNSKSNHNDSQSNSSMQKELPNVSVSENEPKDSDKIKETPNEEKPHVKTNPSNSKANHNDSQSNSSSNKTGNKSIFHSPVTVPSTSHVPLCSKTAKPALLLTPKSLKIVKKTLNSPPLPKISNTSSLPKRASTSNLNTSSPKYAKAAKTSSPVPNSSSPANGSKPSLPSTPNIQPHHSTTNDPSQKTPLSIISKVENTNGGATLRPYEKKFVQNLKRRMNEYLKKSCDVTALIHRGKFSKIFKCRNAEGNDGVVKVINGNCDPYTNGVLKELMLIKLKNEIPENNLNVVRILDGFSANEQWCLLMEYYPKNLRQALQESKKPFHIDQVQHLSRQLATAVASLRHHNIVHSDIKPGHVLLNATNDRLKLCGFDEAYYGECKPVPNIGTVNYRAPEIILGYSTSFSIDVWSTALVMFEMATKRQLFPGCFNNDILFKQMCTVGLVPSDMIQQSRFGHKHFDGAMFMRRMGDKGQDILYLSADKIYKNNILQGTIRGVHERNWYANLSKQKMQEYLTKINQFCALLEQMLVMHPMQRLPIAYVYARIISP